MLARHRTKRGGTAALLLTALLSMILSLLLAPPGASAAEPDTGSLSGAVTDGSGAPVPGTVEFFPDPDGGAVGDPVLTAAVAADGTWRVAVSAARGDLEPGDYLVKATPTGGFLPRWYRDGAAAAEPGDATAVAAQIGVDVVGLDIVVPAEPGTAPPDPAGYLSGRVTDARGLPIAGATVDLFAAGPAAGSGPPSATAVTGADGGWRVAVAQLPPGDYLIRVQGDPALHLVRWYADSPTPEGATAVAVQPSTIRADLDVVLPDTPTTGEIRGQVVANRRTVPGATVTAFGPAGPVQTVQTDERGLFRFVGLPADEYRIRATAEQYSLPAKWYPAAPSRRLSEPVDVQAGALLLRMHVDMSFQPTHPGGPRVRARGPRPPKVVRSAPFDRFTPYQGQRRCIGHAQPGAVSLYYLLKRTYGNITIGLNRRCLRDTSEHYDGRALDWMVSIRNPSQARKGDAFTQWLTRTRGLEVGAMARRLGIMYVIWRDRIWKQYQADKGWQKYYDCGTPKKQRWIFDRPCHRDHVHISMNWPGARKQTSWWLSDRG